MYPLINLKSLYFADRAHLSPCERMESPQLNAIRETDFDGVHTSISYQDDFASGLSAPYCPKLRLGKQFHHRVFPVNESHHAPEL